MFFTKTIQRLLIIASTLFILLFAANSVFADSHASCDITITIPDTTAFEISEITIPVNFDNFLDTLLGFALWIKSDRPSNIFAFKVDSGFIYDTLYWKCLEYSGPDCIDSVNVPADSAWDFLTIDSLYTEVGELDTTGTLAAGWDYVESRSISGNGTDLLVVGIANLPGPPNPSGSAPQQGGTLIKVKANVFQDTDLFTDSTVNLNFETTFIDNFGLAFSDPELSIWSIVEQLDTNCYTCTQWQIDTTQNPPDSNCLNWQQSAIPPCDSVEITLDTIHVLDTNLVCIQNGSVRIVPPPICGDFNGDGVGGNILDLNAMVNCIFRGVCPEYYLIQYDVNCDGFGNILDLNFMVNRIFRNGPAPCSDASCL